MKTILLAIILSSSAMVYGQDAQKSFYLRLGGGYAFSNSGQISFGGIMLQGTSADDGTTTQNSLKKGSLGAGVNGYLGAGYLINSKIAVELGVLAGAAPKEYRYERTHTGNSPGGQHEHHLNETKAVNPVSILPAVVLRHRIGRSFLFYTRAALVLPVAGHTAYIHTQTTSASGISVTTLSTEKITHRFGVGFSGSLGFQYNFGNFGIWLEGTSLNLNRWAKSLERTAFTANGADALSTLNISQRKTDFSYDPVYGTPNTEPAQAPTFPAPYSYLGAMLGVSILF